MSNSCSFPKSSMVTDILVDCKTNVLTIIQTAPSGSEHSQVVDLSCILPQETHISSATYDCDNDQLIIVEETEGECGGPACLTTFIVDMSCIRDGLMPSCDNLVSVTPAPVGSELVVCTPGGAFKTDISAIITELDCSLVPPVCCPRPPLAEFLVCNEGEISRLPAVDVFTCADIPAAASLATDPSVVVCGSRGIEKVPLSEVQLDCADFPLADPAPAGHTLLACNSGGGLISIPTIVARGTSVVEGEGIDVGLIAGADLDTYTVTLDLCELQVDTYENLSNPGPVYMAVCANGQNYKMPYIEAGGSSIVTAGPGVGVSGNGSAGDPYILRIEACTVNASPNYDPASTMVVCSGSDTFRTPVISPGTNVNIASDGTLSVPKVEGSIVLFDPLNYVPLWSQTLESLTDPNWTDTVTIAPPVDDLLHRNLMVRIHMDATLTTPNVSGSDETVKLRASVDGVSLGYIALWAADGASGNSNQWSGEFFVPFNGLPTVDVALTWDNTGGGTAGVTVFTEALLVGATSS